jgi:hypothetical protein
MVKLTPPPAGVRDKTVYDYLYELQEYLKLALDGAGDAGGAAQAAAQQASRQTSAELVRQVNYLKALIIKTADEVESHTAIDLGNLRALVDALGEVIEGDGGLRAVLMEIRGDYVAQSQFGEYAESVAQQLEATANALTQYVAYVSQLQGSVDAVSADFNAWRIESEGYIRSGIVGWREDTTPIIGIAIGQNLTVLQDAEGNDATVTVDGVAYKVVEQKGFRAIYAADELSFWQDDVKVAYMSNNQLYITDIVALASLWVGKWHVDDAAAGLTVKWEG